MSTLPWLRCAKRSPCRICKRPDWCTYQEDGTACCMRVESPKPMHNGGWLHKASADAPAPPHPARPAPVVRINAHALWTVWSRATPPGLIQSLADKLGVTPFALVSLGICWAAPHNAYAFPMRTAAGTIVGLRLRNIDGDQWAVKGSHAGLFIPDLSDFSSIDPLYVAEGASDTAALLTIGLPAIGRPSCLGQEADVAEYVTLQMVKRVVIVSDCDEPGVRGANRLQQAMPVLSCVILPPAKDMRAAVNAGLTARDLGNIVKNTNWTAPR